MTIRGLSHDVDPPLCTCITPYEHDVVRARIEPPLTFSPTEASALCRGERVRVDGYVVVGRFELRASGDPLVELGAGIMFCVDWPDDIPDVIANHDFDVVTYAPPPSGVRTVDQ